MTTKLIGRSPERYNELQITGWISRRFSGYNGNIWGV